MRYTFNVVVDIPSHVSELRDFLELWIANEKTDGSEISYEVKEPRPAPGSLASLDPGTIQLVLGLLSGSGALALTLRSAFQALEKYIETRKVVVKVTYGKNVLELSGRLSEEERGKFVDEFIQHCVEENKK
jgi:hypothetical protein